MIKKLILSFTLAMFLLTTLVTPYAHAQQQWYLQDYQQWYARVYDDQNPDEIFGERYTAAQVEWVLYGMIAFVFNHIIGNTSVITCVFNNWGNNPAIAACAFPIVRTIFQSIGLITDNQTPTNIANTNSIPNLNNIIFSRQLSGVNYLRNAATKFRLVPDVKAQATTGVGFDAAGSVLLLWRAVRNITYFFLILATVVMAFMIMFRVKLSPQTVISVQTALPKLIVTLILVTFSFAIAGFMIDLMYVVFGLVAALLQQSGLFNTTSWGDMMVRITGSIPGHSTIGYMFVYFLMFTLVSLAALASVLGFIGTITGASILLWIIIVVIALIALFIVLLKILWILVKTFVSLLLLIAAGPLIILGGVVGGGGFTGWLKSLVANLAIFPAIGIMFALSSLFLASAIPDQWANNAAYQPVINAIPFRPNPNALGNSTWLPPFLPVGNDLSLVWAFASLAILTLIPKIPDIIKSVISGRPFSYGAAIGMPLTAAAGVAAYPFSQAIGTYAEAQRRQIMNIIGEKSESFLSRMLRRSGGRTS